jgi:hypothetical protein
MAEQDANVDTLQRRLHAPMLARLAWAPQATSAELAELAASLRLPGRA